MLYAGEYDLSVCGEEWYVFESTENLQVGITIDYATNDGVLQSKFFSEGMLLQESEENSVYFNHRSSQGEGTKEILLQLKVKEDAQDLGISVSLQLEESPVVSIEPDNQPIDPTGDSGDIEESKSTGCGGGFLFPLWGFPLLGFYIRQRNNIFQK